jgi:COMPASS component SWD2
MRADVIRYLSLHENKYVRYFQGHKGRFEHVLVPLDLIQGSVTSIDISPCDDTFLSASVDGTARLWDTRSANCQGVIHCGDSQSLAAYDPKGMVFAIGLHQGTINLYDARNHDKVCAADTPTGVLILSRGLLPTSPATERRGLVCCSRSIMLVNYC